MILQGYMKQSLYSRYCWGKRFDSLSVFNKKYVIFEKKISYFIVEAFLYAKAAGIYRLLY